MPEADPTLFPTEFEPTPTRARHTTGILPSQVIRAMAARHAIEAPEDLGIDERQIQPASLDLRLGPIAYRIRASFLPGSSHTVQSMIDRFGMHEIDLGPGAVLERGCVYVVPLLESLSLDKAVSGMANPKSSTGRLDIFTRLITDHASEFDTVPKGYRGPLYAQISPGTFSILVRSGTSLNQLRFRRGNPPMPDGPLRRLHDREGLVDTGDGSVDISGGVGITADLAGDAQTGLIGFRAKKHAGLIDFDRVAAYDPAEFWEPIHRDVSRELILDPGDFYILVSTEAVSVPPDHAAEMRAYDTLVGEFRVHYAGFFDPGFGHSEAGGSGARAVLEVRSHDVPFVLEHRQTVGRLLYERLTEIPDRLYGSGIGSTYQRQGLALAKQFKRPES